MIVPDGAKPNSDGLVAQGGNSLVHDRWDIRHVHRRLDPRSHKSFRALSHRSRDYITTCRHGAARRLSRSVRSKRSWPGTISCAHRPGGFLVACLRLLPGFCGMVGLRNGKRWALVTLIVNDVLFI